MRSVVIASLWMVGCMSTRSVPLAELAPVARGEVGDALVVRTDDVWKSRLDPTSKLRLFNRAHESTGWLRADEVHVVDGWIYVPAVVELLAHAERIRMTGLSPGVLEDLTITRPVVAGTALEIDRDARAAVVVARGAALRTWMTAFIDAVAVRSAPSADVHICAVDTPMATPGQCEVLRGRDRARTYLRHYLQGEPLGTWTLDLGRYGDLVLSESQILLGLETGFATMHGWRWSDVASAQIQDISGIKTLGGIVGTLGLAALAAVVRGGSFASGARLPVKLGVGVPGIGTPGDASPWTGTLADVRGRAAPALFGEGARRRATASVVAQAELALDARDATQILEGGSAAIRVGQLVEFGAGGAHLAVVRGPRAGHYGVAFGRFGVNLPIDARHRYAIPLSMDLGGGGGEQLGVMWRLRSGLQRRLGRNAFAGATVAPMFLNWKHVEQARRWTITAGLEAGVTF